MKKILDYLLNTKRYKFITISAASLLIWTFISVLILYLSGTTSIHNTIIQAKSDFYKFMFGVLFAPLFETFIFQFLIIEFFRDVFGKDVLGIIVSGFVFGLVHYFNNRSIVYSLNATIAGLLFALIYVLSKKRKDVYPFLVVWMIHFFINSLPFVFRLVN